jgi:subtilase family serine protease
MGDFPVRWKYFSLCKFQSGFIPGHSTSHQLIELYHRILLALEAKQVTSVTFADISKAFDTVQVGD